ncbi:MAG: efflux RND transporter periplasmic adaptor subunit [Verrucomicrobiota bacterium]|nr:efflux RND transporter periplasmic adaptor subunit [Verrucomicrobiota bacterium]
MKKIMTMTALLMAMTAWVGAQTCESGDCSCASCAAKADGSFTLPALQGLEKESLDDDHAGHDHGAGIATPDEHAGHDHDAHEGHDHAAEQVAPDAHADCDHNAAEGDHAGHDHGAEATGVELTAEMAQKVGIQIQEAEGGTISKAVVFPAEIKLNRDRAAAVSPRYASMVRQVFAEIGDEVKKGDVLASLENRETMAVYTVAAPLDGIIVSKDLAVGETADGDRVLFEVADLSSVWADISIFPKYQHLLRKDMPVKFIAHDGHTARGTVKYISPIVSVETRTFTARCVLEGADEDFTPGVFVRARINIETADVAVSVPREAVQILEGEAVVFAPGDHGFQALEVELGLADDHSVEIKSGLHPGDRYVAVGAFVLKAQMITSGMDPHAGHGH